MGCSSVSSIKKRPISKHEDPTKFPFVLNLHLLCKINTDELLNLAKEMEVFSKRKKMEDEDRLLFLNNMTFYISALGKNFRKDNNENKNTINQKFIFLRYFFNFPLRKEDYDSLPSEINMEGYLYYENEIIFHNFFVVRISKQKFDDPNKIDEIEFTLHLKKGENYFKQPAPQNQLVLSTSFSGLNFKCGYIVSGDYILDYIKYENSNKMERFYTFIKYVDKFESIKSKQIYCKKAIKTIQEEIEKHLVNNKDNFNRSEFVLKYVNNKPTTQETLQELENSEPNLRQNKSLLNLILIEIQLFINKVNLSKKNFIGLDERLEQHLINFELFLHENSFMFFIDFLKETLFDTIKDFSSINLGDYIKQLVILYSLGVFFRTKDGKTKKNHLIENFIHSINKNKYAKSQLNSLLNKKFILEMIKNSSQLNIIDEGKGGLVNEENEKGEKNESTFYCCLYNFYYHIFFFFFQYSSAREVLIENEMLVKSYLGQDRVISYFSEFLILDVKQKLKLKSKNIRELALLENIDLVKSIITSFYIAMNISTKLEKVEKKEEGNNKINKTNNGVEEKEKVKERKENVITLLIEGKYSGCVLLEQHLILYYLLEFSQKIFS